MKDFDRAIQSFQDMMDMVDETNEGDSSRDEFYEDINLAIECIRMVKSMKKIVG